MSSARLNSLKIKAKLLQKAKKRSGVPIALKDAFAILAEKAGFKSWREMKSTLDMHELLRPTYASGLWNLWFSSYEEAKAHLSASGGYLLPYQKQFFICDDHYVLNLGLKLDDPDLNKVGQNWVEPQDAESWARLLSKIVQAKS